MNLLFHHFASLVITAVSPNVVVTVMLKLKEDRLGLNSGIHTLIYAMTTCNDVVAIFMFGVIISVIFSTSTWGRPHEASAQLDANLLHTFRLADTKSTARTHWHWYWTCFWLSLWHDAAIFAVS